MPAWTSSCAWTPAPSSSSKSRRASGSRISRVPHWIRVGGKFAVKLAWSGDTSGSRSSGLRCVCERGPLEVRYAA